MNLIKNFKKTTDSLEEVGIGLVGSRDVNLQWLNHGMTKCIIILFQN